MASKVERDVDDETSVQELVLEVSEVKVGFDLVAGGGCVASDVDGWQLFRKLTDTSCV